MVARPPSADALLERARALAGWPLSRLADTLGVNLPAEPRRGKGLVGQLVETALGANAGSRPTPDFEHLGIELKTIPVDAQGRPRESTFVTTLELDRAEERAWPTSRLRHKLARVLWVPVEAGPVAVPARRIGWAVLWSPSAEQEAVLREDFEALVELCADGLEHRVTGHVGRALQLRPKGRDATSLRWSIGPEGERNRVAPRAFYLRAGFTRELLRGAWIAG